MPASMVSSPRWRRVAALVPALALVATLVGPVGTAAALPTNPEAKAHLERGTELFKSGDFDAAIEEYRKGYAKEEDPVFLYAWAQAELRQEHCAPAVKLYRKYLETNPPEASAEAARQGILECADKLAADEAPPAPSDTPAEPATEPTTPDEDPVDEPKQPRQKKWSRDPLAISLTTVGIALVGAGVGVLAAGIVQKKKAMENYGEFDKRQGPARNMQIAGAVVLGVGAAVLVGGIVRFAVLGARAKKQRTSVDAMLAPGIAGIRLSGKF